MFLRCSYFLAKSEADVLKNGVRSTCRRRPHLVYTIPTFVLSPNSTGLNIWIGWNLGFRGRVGFWGNGRVGFWGNGRVGFWGKGRVGFWGKGRVGFWGKG